MPFYEYVCLSCETEHLIYHSMAELEADQVCPSCDKKSLSRVISNLKKKRVALSSPKERVKEFIESSRSDLDNEKEKFKNRRKQ